MLLQLKFEILDLIGIFEHVFDKLKVNPSKHKVGIWHFVTFFFSKIIDKTFSSSFSLSV